MKYKPLVHALWLEKVKEALAQRQNTDAKFTSLYYQTCFHSCKGCRTSQLRGDTAGEKGYCTYTCVSFVQSPSTMENENVLYITVLGAQIRHQKSKINNYSIPFILGSISHIHCFVNDGGLSLIDSTVTWLQAILLTAPSVLTSEMHKV